MEQKTIDENNFIKELAEIFAGWEKVIQGDKFSEKRKKQAEEEIIKLTNAIMQLSNGLDILAEIDEFILKNNLI